MKNIHITKITLWGFKGFKTSPIQKSIIEFNNKLQQLISTNGSGKTTFLSECSLSVIDKTMYELDGGKEVEFECDGILYKTTSTHSCNKLVDLTNGTELTQGGTISHYTEIISTLFGYTDYKWRLITGQMEFSKLSTSGRQKWIETISGIDFNYPFKLYGNIKKTITGVRRAIKEYDSELVGSMDRVLGDALRTEKEGRLSELSSLISKIIECKGSTPDSNILKGKISKFKALDDKLKDAKDKVLNDEVNFHHLNVDSLEEFKRSYAADTSELDLIDQKFAMASKELKGKIDLRNKMSQCGKFDMVASKKRLSELDSLLEEACDLLRGTFEDCDVTQLGEISKSSDQIDYNLTLEVMGSIIVGTELPLSKEDITTLRNNIKSNENDSYRLKLELDSVEESIHETKSGKDITCPKCNSTFKDGDDKLSILEARESNINNRLDILGNERCSMESALADINVIEADIKLVETAIIKNVPYSPVRRNAVLACDGTHQLADILSILKVDIGNATDRYRIMCLTKERAELRDTIDHHERMERVGSIDEIVHQCDELEQVLVDIRDDRTRLATSLKYRDKEGKSLHTYLSELDALDSLIVEHSNMLRDVQESIYNSAVGKLLVDLQIEMGKISGELTGDSINSGIRDKLSNMLSRSKAELGVLVDFEVAINPKTGIIAEQLIAYCNIFSGYSSDTLSQIWGYGMEILPPVVHETRGVNYSFPFTVKNEESIPDIGRGSKSQRSIIDLAIVIASRELLNANKQMLILDEVGSGFDVIHNINLGEFMRGLIESSEASNIMVIHHDESIRSMLGDGDTICFDPSNVVVPEGYNEFVQLTYK